MATRGENKYSKYCAHELLSEAMAIATSKLGKEIEYSGDPDHATRIFNEMKKKTEIFAKKMDVEINWDLF